MFFLSLSVDPRIAQERIREKREEMNRLQRFVDENDNLISLVKKLPEKLHHNIMATFRVSAIKTGFKIQGTEKVEQAVRSMYKFVWLAF
ncbi:hypothetical protein F2Q69_00017665 [Brassica cretica]|uniref:Uncharacterized protein n=1 Tax=Brassica cretica TaxID=69181 RepID=A0A8S9QUW7_BRACR|nr:hypothetical protein F2Q69_00017665 [Brassica cretica]